MRAFPAQLRHGPSERKNASGAAAATPEDEPPRKHLFAMQLFIAGSRAIVETVRP
jgi:hypothetical protein